MWKTFIDQWSGIGLFLSPLWDTSDTLSFFSVASGSLGFERIFHKRSFQGNWLPSQQLGEQGIIILWQELYAVNVSCHLWRPHWISKRVRIHCDNQGLVQVINSGQFKVPGLWTFIMDLSLFFCSVPEGALPPASTTSQPITRPHPSFSMQSLNKEVEHYTRGWPLPRVLRKLPVLVCDFFLLSVRK